MKAIKEAIEANRSALNNVIGLRRTVHTISSLEVPLFKEYGITHTQFSVLETLYNKGSLRIQNLIELMLTSSGNMTVVIRNMVRNGWIVRTVDPSDKRACLIQLTPNGRKFIEQILPEHYNNVGQIFSVLTEEERQTLMAILKKFRPLKPKKTGPEEHN